MPIPGNLLTTAMAVMPHTNVDKALEKKTWGCWLSGSKPYGRHWIKKEFQWIKFWNRG